MEDQEFEKWVEQTGTRFPVGFIDDRLKKEKIKAESVFQSESHFIGKWANPGSLLALALRITGLSRKAANNALDLQLRRNALFVDKLPEELHGFKILQISDPHFNNYEGFLDVLVSSIFVC